MVLGRNGRGKFAFGGVDGITESAAGAVCASYALAFGIGLV
jgi:hypothetical protein